MKFNFNLMDAVIKDLESRGAVVMAMVDMNKNQDSQVRGDWTIDAKWQTGRYWTITDVEGIG
jgi:hypothetical protein